MRTVKTQQQQFRGLNMRVSWNTHLSNEHVVNGVMVHSGRWAMYKQVKISKMVLRTVTKL